jgi:Rrf2 family protein
MVDTRFSVSIQIMMTMAWHRDELLNSEMLAGVLKTNATFIRKLVSNLVAAGLIESFRGKGGGIKLAKSPDKISLKEIYIAATEEKTLIKSHKKPVLKSCAVSCSFDEIICDVVDGIESATKTFLGKKTLQDMIKNVSHT